MIIVSGGKDTKSKESRIHGKKSNVIIQDT
jgi:hypothetical protein